MEVCAYARGPWSLHPRDSHTARESNTGASVGVSALLSTRGAPDDAGSEWRVEQLC